MRTRILASITSYLPAARRSFFTTAALFVLAASANAQWIFNPATGHEYSLTCGEYWGASDTSARTPPDWFDAEAEAVFRGGHLATINDEAENLWLRDTFGPYHYWVGLTDWASEGTFYWISGEPVTYLNWDVGQPDNAHAGGEDTVHINHFGSFGWNDLGAKGNSPYHPNPYRGIIERVPGAGGGMPLQVTTTNPAVGGTFSPAAPGDYQYDVNFNQAVYPASVEATDLTLTGMAGSSVTSVQLINSNMTARFTLHFNSGGSVTASIADGAITGDTCNAAFTGNYSVQACQTSLQVTTTNPAVGGTFSPPAPGDYEFDVNFNQAVDPASVQTSDLTLNGIVGSAVTNVQLINSNMTARFTLHFNFGGPVTASIAEGAIRGTADECNVAFTGNYTVEGSPPPCLPPPANMVSWWPGDNNADDIVGSNNGTLEGGATFAPGEVAQAFVFDGTTSDAKIPASSTLDAGSTGTGLTIDAWINPSDVMQQHPLVEWDDASEGVGLHLWISVTCCGGSAGNLYANVVDNTGSYYPIQSADGIIQANTWQHVALTYDKPTGLATLYLNGAVVAQQNLGTFTPQTSYDLYFGFRLGTTFRYGGAMDEIEIFNRALSEQEIQAIYNAGSEGKCKPEPTPTPTPGPCVEPPPDMVGWWTGDGNANDIIDGNNGAFVGNASYSTGEVSQGFSFDGSNYVEIPDAPNLSFGPTSPISVDMWLYRTGEQNVMHFLGKRSGCAGTVENYQIGFNDRDNYGYFWHGVPRTGRSLPLNTWTHIAGTFDGTTFKLYENGELIGSGGGTLGPTNTVPLRIAKSGDCENFVGLIDEVELFNRALTQTEIQSIYNAGSAGKCKGTPTPTATATATATYTPTPTATATFTPIPTATFTPTPTPTFTPTPTPTSTPPPSPTPTPTPTATPACVAQVQPPINADGSSVFNVRRGVIPVKFTLSCDGHPTCDLSPATIAVTRTAGGVVGQINESVYTGPSDSGSNFRIDGCAYHYNLTSSTLGVGTYRVDILINSQVVGSATFQLK